ncbi:MAG: hypothetical protein AAGF95_12385 [Chloroflexota bacterium]
MPSSNHKTQPQRREPLRWLALGVVLLAFIAICCTSQIVTYVLTPRNLASQLLLLSPNNADYSPWRDGLQLPPLAPEVPEAMAAERSTAELALTATPTPILVGAVPTGIVAIVPPPPNAPQPTPAGVRIVLVPTPTPTIEQPAAGGANTPVPTAPPSQPNNPVPSDTSVPAPVTPTTDTEDRPEPNPTDPVVPPTNPPDSGGETTPVPPGESPTQPIRPTPEPRPPQPTSGPTAQPPATQPPTQEPVRPTPRPRPPAPTATFTPEPPPPTATLTPRPVQPTATFTPRPVQPTPTFTPEPPPPTPTFTPIPEEDPEVSKSMSPSNPNLGDTVTYTIEITNNTGTEVTISSVVDVIVLDEPPAEPFALDDCRGILSGSQVGGCGNLGGVITWSETGGIVLPDGEIFVVEIEGAFQSIGETYTFCNSDYTANTGTGSVSGANEVCVTFNE